jgi:hypothetical protein
MATVSMATWTGASNVTAGTALSGAVRVPYLISRTFNVADIVTKKGSAIAASDVIECLNVPKNSYVLGAWLSKDTAVTGTMSVCTLSLGITGVSATAWASAYDFFAAAAGARTGTITASVNGLVTTADTIDLLVASLTGTWTGGNITVSALIVDVDNINRPGLAALQS